jgi:hypothetical protein
LHTGQVRWAGVFDGVVAGGVVVEVGVSVRSPPHPANIPASITMRKPRQTMQASVQPRRWW